MNAVETLRIKNFAGIKDARIELSRMNVFIGPQASGKSVCAKLLFYFKENQSRLIMMALEGRTEEQVRDEHRERFLKYFPLRNLGESNFQIEYNAGAYKVTIDRADEPTSLMNISYSQAYDTAMRTLTDTKVVSLETEDSYNPSAGVLSAMDRVITSGAFMETQRFHNEKNYFIAAGRSFFSTIRSNVFSLLASGVGIDPFLAEFGRLYELARRYYLSRRDSHVLHSVAAEDSLKEIVCGTYKQDGQRDYILTNDGRQVGIENASSGQQEVLPLALTLLMLAAEGRLAESTLYIEEPEAHLYPTAQREIVHLLAAVTDLASDKTSGQYVITTHSPYILSALNNLMYGAQLAAQSPDKRSRVAQVLGDAALVPAENVRAYAFGEGQVQSIIDAETGLVRATVLDSVSNELAKEFGDLLDIEFEEDEIAA